MAKKILIKKSSERGAETGSNFYPLFDYYASKGNFPNNSHTYFEDKQSAFTGSQNGYTSKFRWPIDYDDTLNRFEFEEGLVVNKASIYDKNEIIRIRFCSIKEYYEMKESGDLEKYGVYLDFDPKAYDE